MKDLSKHVVILDNIPSPYIYQAIIILKKYPPDRHEKIIEEAEKIVSSYFENNSIGKYCDKKEQNLGLKSAVVILSLSLIASIAFSLLR